MTDRKYPAHSTEPYRAPDEDELYLGPYELCGKCGLDWYACKCNKTKKYEPQPKRTISHGMKVIAFSCIFVSVLVAWGFGMSALINKPQASVQNEPAIVPVLHTNTAEPSATPNPTRTPYPTFTHTIPTLTPESGLPVEVVYIEKEVTRIVERVITQTPQPATATLQPTWTPSPTVDLTATQVVHNGIIERRHETVISYIEVIATILGTVIIFVFAGNAVYSWIADLIAKRRKQLEAVPEDEPIPINDANRERRIIQLHKAGWSISQIQQKVFGYMGGSDFYTVKDIIDEYNATTPPPPEDVPEIGATQA